jgi:hypothetical protein
MSCLPIGTVSGSRAWEAQSFNQKEIHMKNKISSIGAALAAWAFCAAAQAATITGSISFASGAAGGVIFGPTNNLATATSIEAFTQPIVTEASGSFAVIASGTSVDFTQPYVFAPSTPYSPLWTVSGGGSTFEFILSSTLIAFQSSSFLALEGTGSLTGTGFDPTPGTWRFTSQGPSTGGKFSWSSAVETAAREVPDGGTTLALLGATLLGLHGVRRRFGVR